MTYRALVETLDTWFATGRQAAGGVEIPCRRGCGACCLGVFDISSADAALVAEGLATLPADRRAALRAGAEAQLERCADLLSTPGWGPPWDVDTLPEPVFDALSEALAAAPCPALDPDGGCAIYDHRPATCRMTGLAMDAGVAGRLDNECPVQGEFPDYAALSPTPFDLIGFERAAHAHDELARARGFRTTTVAAAIASAPRRTGEGADSDPASG